MAQSTQAHGAEANADSFSPLVGVGVVLLIAAIGLFYVKWLPYYQRALTAFASHSIGPSVLTGGAQHIPQVSLQAAADYALAYGKAIWRAMLLGLVLGSALQELMPRAWIARALGYPSWRTIAIGGALSIPGMMCTCCAAPVVISLRTLRATASSAVAFWLGNTLLNPATLVFLGFVLGWRWASFRLVFGLLMVVGVSYAVNRLGKGDERVAGTELAEPGSFDYRPTFAGWWRGFVKLAGGLIPETVVLVMILGALRAILFPEHGGVGIDNSLLWIVLMALAGLLFVIPTAGEVPIVQALLTAGVGVGPAAALLLTLPPVSLPSLVLVRRVFSLRVILVIALAVATIGIAAGIAAEVCIAP